MTNPTPMTREQAWERVTESLDYLVGELQRSDVAIDTGHAALEALAFLRTEMERLEGERDEAARAAGMMKQAADEQMIRADELQSTVERLEGENERLNKDVITAALVKAKSDTRIAELKAALREAHDDVENERYANALEVLHAALPDTEGPE